ncbi:hypothetical protein psal_cds_29 [Pandoravirus salinus]|uniref:Uncharacterized protein n=1 Tax=Pandoravirus salinus TaxID=1349410 RepID=S4VZZ3_9VIRU|nr:hypothetical protein psal_cds_29 [Pandoravirus salinus]AGO83400.1 hypothetical protein psal_cds_29 [Pandoravirus salinus]
MPRARQVIVGCAIVAIAVELVLAVALAVVVSRSAHDAAIHHYQEQVVARLVITMFAVALGTPLAMMLGLVFIVTKEQPGTRVLAAQIDHVFSASEAVEVSHAIDADLAHGDAIMSALAESTWCGRPQRDPALCHHAWRVHQWGHLALGIYWFAGNGFDGLGWFHVRGCANPCVPDGTTLLAWTQAYREREGVCDNRRFSYEFRGTLTSDPDGALVIGGTWDRHTAGEGADVRPGDIVHGEFVLVRAPGPQGNLEEVAPTHDNVNGNNLDGEGPIDEDPVGRVHTPASTAT